LGYERRGGYRPSGFGPKPGPKPVEVGKEYDVDISEVSSRGDGIARIQGFVIFVSEARAGQHVKIKVTRVGERSANAEIVRSAT